MSISLSLSLHYQKTLCLSLSLMAFSDKSLRQSLISSFLYSSSSIVSTLHKSFGLDNTMLGAATPASSNNGVSSPTRNFVIPALSEPGKIEMYSPTFYVACTASCERPRPRPPFLYDVRPNPCEWVESCYCLSK